MFDDVRSVLLHLVNNLALGLGPGELGLVRLRLQSRDHLALRQQVFRADRAQHRRWLDSAVQARIVLTRHVLVEGEILDAGLQKCQTQTQPRTRPKSEQPASGVCFFSYLCAIVHAFGYHEEVVRLRDRLQTIAVGHSALNAGKHEHVGVRHATGHPHVVVLLVRRLALSEAVEMGIQQSKRQLHVQKKTKCEQKKRKKEGPALVHQLLVVHRG